MKKTAAIRLIREAYDAIPDLQDGFTNVKDRLYEMNLRAERVHRKHRPYSITKPFGLTVDKAAKYFVIKHLLDGVENPDRFSVTDILHIRNEILYAQAYAKRHLAELQPWFEKYKETARELDYSELVKE